MLIGNCRENNTDYNAVYSVLFVDISTTGFKSAIVYKSNNAGYAGEPYSWYACGY